MDIQTLAPVKKTNNKGQEEIIEPFLIIRSANGIETKICNFEHPGICKRTGKIEIRAIKKHKTKQPNFMFKTYKDSTTDIRFGIPAGTDNNGNIIWQNIALPEMRLYDLTDVNDAKEWAVVRNSHFLKGSPRQFGEPKFEIIDHEEQAQKNIKKLKDSRRASEIIDNIAGSEMIDFARIMGIDTESNSQNIVLGMLAEKAHKSPRYFLEKYDDSNRKILAVIHRCLATGEVVYNTMDGYKTKSGFPLGTTESSIVSHFLKPENHSMFISLDVSSKKLDKHFKLKEGENYEEVEMPERFVVGEDPEKAALKELVEKQGQQLSEVTANMAKMMEMFMAKGQEPIESEPKTENTSDKEYSDIRLEAREMGIKAWHNKKEEDLLREMKELRLSATKRDSF
jgi:hypothetical protein